VSAWACRGLSAHQGPFHLGPIDLELGRSEVVAVIGRSGAGKTTLLRTLAGFLPADAGSIGRDGTDLTTTPPEGRRAVYVPAGLALFPHRSVAGNIAYPLELAGGRADGPTVGDLLDRFGLAPLADRRPSTLSAGEQQRVALARSVAADPALLLWDEPLGALDLVAREALLAGLRTAQAGGGRPIVLVTHDPAVAAAIADRWLLLDGGRTAFLGSADACVARPPDPFAARFAGYANVLVPDDLARETGLRSLVADRAGNGGVATTPFIARPSDGEGGVTAVVDRRTPTPDGVRLTAHVGTLALELRAAADVGDRIRVGDRVAVNDDGTVVVPIGPTGV